MIKQEALRLGFSFVGVSKAEFLKDEAPRLESWLKKSMHGEMSYMERNFDKRLDPRLLVEGAQSNSWMPEGYSAASNCPTVIPLTSKILISAFAVTGR